MWFKACQPVQAFEPQLTAELSRRWPGLVARVVGHDPARAWLLTADAGAPFATLGNSPGLWLEVLPRYAELQSGEAAHASEHVAHGVPDLRTETLPTRYEVLLRPDLPIPNRDRQRLRRFASRFIKLCAELVAESPLASIQHDDLHLWNVYADGPARRVLDWGDASVAHPFFSLVVTFRFLQEVNGLAPGDHWFARLRDAYLEPWGPGLTGVFDHALRIGHLAHLIAGVRQRDALPAELRPDFDRSDTTVVAYMLGRSIHVGHEATG